MFPGDEAGLRPWVATALWCYGGDSVGRPAVPVAGSQSAAKDGGSGYADSNREDVELLPLSSLFPLSLLVSFSSPTFLCGGK
ncbi:hypothetical protein DM860_011603 [Cuscuta australis]|uniref:Uncharacterized protein n=1 Tax=Cuscuta australis TaxID=267555 RepID=A0A328D043_9ASTE|nr:hypothetical protein DM860_011603 [Cuscuta australis]